MEGFDGFKSPLKLPVEVFRHDVCLRYRLVDGVSGEAVEIVDQERDDLWVLGYVASFDEVKPGSDLAYGFLLEQLTDIGKDFFFR